jgi:N-acetylmuramic acid 6-phosphate etherase
MRARGGALTALVTCADTPGRVEVDHLLNPRTGAELIAGSTRLKAGTATKMVLNMISTGLMVRMNKVHRGLMVDVSATNEKLMDRAMRIYCRLTGASRAEALEHLREAGGSVKAAVVMRERGCSLGDAAALLERLGGSLRAALNDDAGGEA